MQSESELINLLLSGNLSPNYVLTSEQIRAIDLHYYLKPKGEMMDLLGYCINNKYWTLAELIIDSKQYDASRKISYGMTAFDLLLEQERRPDEEVQIMSKLAVKLCENYNISFNRKLSGRSILLSSMYLDSPFLANYILDKSKGHCLLSNVDPENFCTALEFACWKKWIETANKILDYGMNGFDIKIFHHDREDNDALQLAINNGLFDIAEKIKVVQNMDKNDKSDKQVNKKRKMSLSSTDSHDILYHAQLH